MAHYFDTSALVPLVVADRRSTALWRWWSRASTRVASSQIVRTELVRSVRRLAPDNEEAAHGILRDMVLTRVTPAILDTAALLEPASLGSLDAIHLASALDLGRDLEGFVTYDERLAAAARGYGIVVVRPS